MENPRSVISGDRFGLWMDEGGYGEVRWKGATLLREVTAHVRYRVRGQPKTFTLAGPGLRYGLRDDRAVISRDDGEMRVDWHVQLVEGILSFEVELSNVGTTPIEVDTCDVLSVPAGGVRLAGPPADWRVYQHGWQSWSATGSRRLGDGPIPLSPSLADYYPPAHVPHDETGILGEWVSVVWDGQLALLVGFVETAEQLARVRVVQEEDGGKLEATAFFDGVPLEPGASLRSALLQVDVGEDALDLLERYAARWGARMNARVGAWTPTGWCSWYYFFGGNTADDVLDNVEVIEREKLPLDVVLVDDGYQAAIGDWLEPNPDTFPGGMKELARSLCEAGHRPGIWTAPFGVAPGAKLFQAHPDWVVRDAKGDPLVAWFHMGVGEIYVLDTTHPEVLTWLEETFRTLREWGYELFKIDFLFAAAQKGRRYDQSVTRAQALRRGVAAIRRGIGEDAFLLGCGAPLGPCVGLVDGMRVGPDVAPSWEAWDADPASPGVFNALRNSLARAWMHRRLWINDPDCVLVRPTGDEGMLKLSEVRTLVTVIGMLGGAVIDSDHLPLLPPRRIDLLRMLLPPLSEQARPVDLMERTSPSRLVVEVERPWGRWWIVALINWEDSTAAMRVDLRDLGLPDGEYHVVRFWHQRYRGRVRGHIDLRLGPHEVALLGLRPVRGEPDLLLSTFHIGQGAVEVTSFQRYERAGSGQTLVLRLERPVRSFGRLWFTLPQGWRVAGAQVGARRRGVNVIAPGVIGLGFSLDQAVTVRLDFVRE